MAVRLASSHSCAAAGTGWRRVDSLHSSNSPLLVMLAISDRAGCDVPASRLDIHLLRAYSCIPASMSVARITIHWPSVAKVSSEHRSFSYDFWLGSACVGAQTAKLHGVVCKYRLLLLCCGDCLFCIVVGSHTYLHVGIILVYPQ
jgi:hypothetical protein